MALETRYQVPLFSMIDYESVEMCLEAMTAKGWEIEETGKFLWKYRKTTPKKKKFAVVFSQDSSDYSPLPTKGQQFLKEICEENGWEKKAEWNRMQIFSCDDTECELQTDEVARLNSIQRAMKKFFIPSATIAVIGMIFLAMMNMVELYSGNSQDESNTLWAIFIALYAAMALVIMVAGYWLWVKLSEGSLRKGGKCVNARWHSRLQYGLVAGALILVGVYFAGRIDSSSIGGIAYALVCVSILIMVAALVNLFTKFLKSRGFSKMTNIICSTAVCALLVILAPLLLMMVRTVI